MFKKVKHYFWKRKFSKLSEYKQAEEMLVVIRKKMRNLKLGSKGLEKALESNKKAIKFLEDQRIAVSKQFNLFDNGEKYGYKKKKK